MRATPSLCCNLGAGRLTSASSRIRAALPLPNNDGHGNGPASVRQRSAKPIQPEHTPFFPPVPTQFMSQEAPG
jgi:hypothetical protein